MRTSKLSKNFRPKSQMDTTHAIDKPFINTQGTQYLYLLKAASIRITHYHLVRNLRRWDHIRTHCDQWFFRLTDHERCFTRTRRTELFECRGSGALEEVGLQGGRWNIGIREWFLWHLVGHWWNHCAWGKVSFRISNVKWVIIDMTVIGCYFLCSFSCNRLRWWRSCKVQTLQVIGVMLMLGTRKRVHSWESTLKRVFVVESTVRRHRLTTFNASVAERIGSVRSKWRRCCQRQYKWIFGLFSWLWFIRNWFLWL